MSKLSRRSFLKGTAVSALGAAALGMTACSNNTAASSTASSAAASAPASSTPAQQPAAAETGKPGFFTDPYQYKDTDAVQVVTTEVVVVGAGNAGCTAACSCVENGSEVVVIEAQNAIHGQGGGVGLCNTKYVQSLVDEGKLPHMTDVVEHQNIWIQRCGSRVNEALVSMWFNNSPEAGNWLIDKCAEFGVVPVSFRAHAPNAIIPESYDYHMFVNVGDHQFDSKCGYFAATNVLYEDSQNAEKYEHPATYFFNTKAQELLVEDGRVTGVIIRDAQNGNKYIQLNAAKGVILATGDNSGDEKIMKHFAPEIVEKNIANMGAMGMLGVDVEGKTVETGDGLRMGAWIGAKVQDHHAPMTHHMGSGMGVTPFLQLNKRGERFMNECIPGQQLENQIELQPECASFQLYDAKWGEQIPYMPANHGGLCYIIPENEDESNPNYTDRQYTKISAKAEAYQFKADTLEELLTQCGYEGEALDTALASIQRYNELAKAGSDDDFGKPASRMFALENPPYYACQWGTTAMLVCVGGLESDENCHTFTEEDPASPKRDIIKGLYVCGNVQGSRYAVEYPICMRGISHSLCVYYGYIAGKNCVAGV